MLIAAVALSLIAIGAVAFWTGPQWLVPMLARKSPGCTYYVETNRPLVALTIDDGPDSATTPKILHVLAAHDAHATFFLISSRVQRNEDLVHAMVDGGHEIGNHFTHDEPAIRLAPDRFEAALREADALLSGYGPLRWARPGSGWYSRRMVETLEQHDYRCALGSVYPFDATIPSVRFAAGYVLRNIRPGAIIVLHDYGRRGERTAKTLGRILPELNRMGYRVVTLTELDPNPRPAAYFPL